MPDVTVELDHYATVEEVVAVEEALRESGLVGDVRVSTPPDPAEAPEDQIGNGYSWMVAVVVAVPMLAFLRQLGTRAGDEAFDALKALVGRLWNARRSARPPDGWVEFEDSEGTRLLIGEPAEDAFDKLREMDPEEWRGKRLRWDEQLREWVEW